MSVFVSLSIYSLARRYFTPLSLGINVVDRAFGRHMGGKIRSFGNGNEFVITPLAFCRDVLFGPATALTLPLGHAV
ncbi:MAG: hypothetical protein CM15mP21_5540 [Hyphomicrobiales bacterium]|nr:MAG: hypothetical protein CM15mP21_5540 [Hyphomicrobiales bacterium]